LVVSFAAPSHYWLHRAGSLPCKKSKSAASCHGRLVILIFPAGDGFAQLARRDLLEDLIDVTLGLVAVIDPLGLAANIRGELGGVRGVIGARGSLGMLFARAVLREFSGVRASERVLRPTFITIHVDAEIRNET